MDGKDVKHRRHLYFKLKYAQSLILNNVKAIQNKMTMTVKAIPYKVYLKRAQIRCTKRKKCTLNYTNIFSNTERTSKQFSTSISEVGSDKVYKKKGGGMYIELYK